MAFDYRRHRKSITPKTPGTDPSIDTQYQDYEDLIQPFTENPTIEIEQEPAPPPKPKLVPDYSWEDVKKTDGVIGVQSPSFHLGATDSDGDQVTTATSGITTTFDTSSKADSAHIYVVNGTGGTITVRGAQIRGKLVFKKSPPEGGFIHDGFRDDDDIRKNGEKRFTLINDYIVSSAQVAKLADYYWKFFGGDDSSAKHVYTIRMHGNWAWLEPGNRYTLQIGGAGQQEYINASCELLSITSNTTSKGIGKSTIVLREMQTGWTKDTGIVARTISYGRQVAYKKTIPIVTVAPSTYSESADYYCDGTADEVEINAAIKYVGQALNGGTVGLLPGTYNITDNISLSKNVTLQGQGNDTVINGSTLTSANDKAIVVSNSWGFLAHDARVQDLKISNGNTNTIDGSNALLFVTGCERVRISNVIVEENKRCLFKAEDASELVVQNCIFKNGCLTVGSGSTAGPGSTYGSSGKINAYMNISNCDSVFIHDNEFVMSTEPTVQVDGTNAIFMTSSAGGYINNNYIHNFTNKILETAGANDDNDMVMIFVQGYPYFDIVTPKDTVDDVGTIISGNKIQNCYNLTNRFMGIISKSDRNQVVNNQIINSGGNWASATASHSYDKSPSIQIIGSESQCNNNEITDSFGGIYVGDLWSSSSTDNMRNLISGNHVSNVGQRILYATCEQTTAPTLYNSGTAYTTNVTYARSSDQAQSGAYSYKITSSGSGAAEVQFHDSGTGSDMQDLIAGVTYTLVCWVYIPSGVGITGTGVTLVIQDYDSSWGATSQACVNTYGEWQMVRVERSLRTNATGIALYITWTASGSGEYLYIDNVRLFPSYGENQHRQQFYDNGNSTRY